MSKYAVSQMERVQQLIDEVSDASTEVQAEQLSKAEQDGENTWVLACVREALCQPDFSLEIDRDRTGERLGQYVLTEKSGEGGMGVVYRARKTTADGEQVRSQEFAVKLIHPELMASGDDAVERFRREVSNLSSLNHPAIVQLEDAGTELSEQGEETHYLVMPWIRGRSLSDYLCANNLTQTERLELFTKIAHALSVMHERGLAHADLKPANIRVDHGGEPVILDLGLANSFRRDDMESPAAGTPMYMSPEQARGERPTPQSDVYSLGVILFEMITGQRAYSLATSSECDLADELAGVRPLLSLVRDRRLRGILSQTLAKDPGERLNDAASLSLQVEKWLRRDRVSQPAVAIGILVMLSLIASGGWFWQWNSQRTKREELRNYASTILLAQAETAVRLNMFATDYPLADVRESAKSLSEQLGHMEKVRDLALELAAKDEATVALAKASAAVVAQEYQTAIDLLKPIDWASLEPSSSIPDMEARAYRVRADAHQGLDQFTPALLYYDRAISASPEDVVVRLRSVQPLMGLQNYDSALVRLDSIPPDQLPTAHDQAVWHDLRGTALGDKGRLIEAVDELASAIALHKQIRDTVRAWENELCSLLYKRAGYLATSSRFDEAIADLQESLDICERLIDGGWEEQKIDFAGGHANLANFYQMVGNSDAAYEAYGTAIEVFRELAEVTKWEGIADKFHALTLYERGTAYLADQEFGSASSDFEASAEIFVELLADQQHQGLEPDYIACVKQLAFAHLRCGREEDACKCAERACELTDYKDVQSLALLADGFAQQKKWSEAIKWVESAMDHSSTAQRRQLQSTLERYRSEEAKELPPAS